METVSINFKTEKTTKILLEQLCERIGISTTSLLNMFINKSIKENGIPFKVGYSTMNEISADRLKDLQMIDKHFGEFAALSKRNGINTEEDVAEMFRKYRKERRSWK